jgi:hypothetical protein
VYEDDDAQQNNPNKTEKCDCTYNQRLARSKCAPRENLQKAIVLHRKNTRGYLESGVVTSGIAKKKKEKN